jgi:hypothetical protein
MLRIGRLLAKDVPGPWQQFAVVCSCIISLPFGLREVGLLWKGGGQYQCFWLCPKEEGWAKKLSGCCDCDCDATTTTTTTNHDGDGGGFLFVLIMPLLVCSNAQIVVCCRIVCCRIVLMFLFIPHVHALGSQHSKQEGVESSWHIRGGRRRRVDAGRLSLRLLVMMMGEMQHGGKLTRRVAVAMMMIMKQRRSSWTAR